MASMKYDLSLLDYKTRFSLWQEKTAAELWLKLESICMSKDLTSKMHIKMKLFSHKFQESGSVLNHISVFKEIVADLMSMEVQFDDEDLGLLLLCSLPSSYTNFCDTILLSRDEVTLAEVYEALQNREKMKGMVQSDASSSKGEALLVKGRSEQRTYNDSNDRDKSQSRGRSKSTGKKFCKYCKKKNHFIEECWKLQNKDNRKSDGKASVVTSAENSNSGDCLVVFAGCVASHDEWILDTACSFHICINRDWFSSYKSVQNGDVVCMGDDNPHVRHIPGMARNLISLSTLDAEGYKYSGSGGVVKVSKGSLVYMIGDMNSANLYVLRGSTLHGSVTAAAVSKDEPSKTNLWHMRLGHMSELGMAELMKRNLLDGCTQGNMKFCEHCVFGKHKRVKFNTSVHRTKEWKVMIERQTEKEVKVLRTDNGGKFCSDAFDDYCRKEGIVRHHTIPYTPQQNGVAERMNRTIISKARCMLSNTRMNKRFWAEAANTAYYLINRSPSI
uniref:OSJNBb0013J13.10 protein n=1 Tax=Oryza sativa subsp. japonica TaxID=39947 RepID=Q7XP10_ORYSJ|nr:OSJNBb0013J13.10 [Oryza sativa Japonica Group]